MTREAKFLWMRDILDHLGECYEQWQLADPDCEHFIAESMKHNLQQIHRLCESMEPGRSAPRGDLVASLS